MQPERPIAGTFEELPPGQQVVVAIRTRNHEAVQECLDRWCRRFLRTITEILRHDHASILGDAAPPRFLRMLQSAIHPHCGSRLLQRAMELLEEGDLPVWRRLFLTRVALRRLAFLLDESVPELPAGTNEFDILQHLRETVRRHARRQ